jgi:hypothetical protein
LATVGGIGWHTNGSTNTFYIAGHPDHGPLAGNNVRLYGFGSGSDLLLGNSTLGDAVTLDGATGYLGIGTISPQEKLHLEGLDYTNSSMRFLNKANTNTDYWSLGVRDFGGSDEYFSFSRNGGDAKVIITDDGNVGVGTLAPTAKFHVYEPAINYSMDVEMAAETYSGVSRLSLTSKHDNNGDLIGEVYFNNYNGTNDDVKDDLAGIRAQLVSYNGQGYSYSDLDDAANLVFWTQDVQGAEAEVMYITHEGKVGINESYPNTTLHVNGDVELNNLTASANTENRALLLNGTDKVVSRTLNSVAFNGESQQLSLVGNNLSISPGGNTVSLSSLNLWTRDATNGEIYPTTIGDQVGIGTTDPSADLDVKGVLELDGAIPSDPGTDVVRLGDATNLHIQTNYGYTRIGPLNANWSHFKTDRNRFYFDKGITVDEGLIGSYSQDLQLQTSGTTRIYVNNSNGYVGIGTTDPDELLEVSSATGAYIRFEDEGSHHFKIGTDDQNNYLDFRDGDGTDIMVVDGTNDRVGIGDETPDAKLHIKGSNNTRVRIESDNIGVNALTKDMFGLEMVTGGMNTSSKYGTAIKFMSDDVHLATESPKFLAGIIPRARETYAGDGDGGMAIDFATTNNNPGATSVPSVKMTIDNDGNVGIGTTSPEHTLDVDGNIGGLLIGYKKVFINNSNIADAGEFMDATNGYIRFRTPSHGRVLVTADFYYASGWHSTTDQVEVKLVNSNNTSDWHGWVGVCTPYQDYEDYKCHAEFIMNFNAGYDIDAYLYIEGHDGSVDDSVYGWLYLKAYTLPSNYND